MTKNEALKNGGEMNHCLIVNYLSICWSPDNNCEFFLAGYGDCFYHVAGRCCNAKAIMKATVGAK